MLKISLEASKVKIVDTSGKQGRLLKLASAIPGINVAKKFAIARFRKDDVVMTFFMNYIKKNNIEVSIDQEVNDWFTQEAKKNKAIAEIKSRKDDVTPLSYNDKLRPYQRVDINLLMHMQNVILGNDPGTGKTIEAIGYADAIKAKKILVIGPLSILGNWKNEIEAWSEDPRATIINVDSSYKRLEKMRKNLQEDSRFYIGSYSLLQMGVDKVTNRFKALDKLPELFKQKWDIVFVDEAHVLKNKKTQLSRGIELLKKNSLVLMTGTWINKNHNEVFRLLQLMDKNRFGSYWSFVERFNETEENYMAKAKNKNSNALTIIAPRNKEAYRYMMNSYVIQRYKRDVLTELPDVIYQKIPIQLSSAERKLYDKFKEELIVEVEENNFVVSPNVMTQETRLRQLLLHPSLVGSNIATNNKTDRILEIVEEAERQVVIFSSSRVYIELLAELLTKNKITNTMITGKVRSADERTRRVQDFTNGKYKVMLGTIAAMKEGLNLQVADTLIFADKSYVPGENQQAIARIDRLGQKNNPIIYDLITENSIEEYIDEVVTTRQDLIDEMSSLQEIIKKMVAK